MAVNIGFNEQRFLTLLANLIGETQYLQNNPPDNVPEEDRAIKHVVDALTPYTKENGGPITIQHITYVEGRGNLIIEYKKGHQIGAGTVTFIGSHLDVVPANRDTWNHDPFKLTREGDKLYGRGTTDCLGHVAMITEFFLQLAETAPDLKRKIVAVFIASEENNSIPNIGVDMLLKDGKLDNLKNGPLYWVDTSDSQPCLGTASAAMWTLKCSGRLAHSGLPQQGINSLELSMDATTSVQKKFYQDYPPHSSEAVYNFEAPSSMKPTITQTADGSSVNQIPPSTDVQGDIRLTPFYDIDVCMKKVEGYVAQLNNDPNQLVTGDRGPSSNYEISTEEGDFKAELEVVWDSEPMRGIACNLNSDGYKALRDATQAVMGEVKPFSLTGSLPVVGDMQKDGYDIQMCGYGDSAVYHGDNEYCSLNEMKNGVKVFAHILNTFNQ